MIGRCHSGNAIPSADVARHRTSASDSHRPSALGTNARALVLVTVT
jgi:hypothetical protein